MYVWNVSRMPDLRGSLITEMFGIFIAYSEIMENHLLYGKCPFHWDKKDQRPRVKFKIFGCFRFWINLVMLTVSLIIPGILVVLRFVINKLGMFGYFEENVPFHVITIYCCGTLMIGSILLIFLPVIFFWEWIVVSEIERTCRLFQRLLEGKLFIYLLRISLEILVR